MDDSGKLVDIDAFGTRYRVKASPESEQRIRRAVSYLEKKVEEASDKLNRPMTDRVPPQLFYSALDITEELLMLREQIENDKQLQREQIARLGRIVDRSLTSRFVKVRMAYGAERQEGG